MRVNLGTTNIKRGFFPQSFDSSTTCNFGEVLPTFAKEVIANSSCRIDINSACRFAPLSNPTYGKATLRHYIYYIKYSDLYRPFDFLLAGKPYRLASGASAVPDRVPHIPLNLLWHIAISSGTVTFYKVSNAGASGNDTVKNGLRRVTRRIEEYSVEMQKNLFNVLLTRLKEIHPIGDTGDTYSDSIIDAIPHRYTLAYSSNPSIQVEFNNSPITPSGADFFFCVGVESQANTFAYCAIKLDARAKRLRKILIGLGYKLNADDWNTQVSMLPLFAFYKAYFDAFAPKRFVNYEDTSCYAILDAMAEHNDTGLAGLSRVPLNFGSFINELALCFYTKNADYFSSAISGTAINPNQVLLKGLGYNGTNVQATAGNNLSPTVAFGGIPKSTEQVRLNLLERLTKFINKQTVTGGKINEFLRSTFGYTSDVIYESDFVGADAVDVNFGDVMQSASTEDGVLGDYAGQASGFKSLDGVNIDCKKYGIIICLSTLVPRTQYVTGIDASRFHIERFDFYTPMLDGVTLMPTKKYSLFVNEYLDSRLANSFSGNFGNLPVYSEYKVPQCGILNGDLSLNSTKSTFDNFTLDTKISEEVLEFSNPSNVNEKYVAFYLPDSSSIVEGIKWQYVNAVAWIGQYNRIFVNNGSESRTADENERLFDDNVVVHNTIDFKYHAPMLSIGDSFDTKEDVSDKNGIKTEHV